LSSASAAPAGNSTSAAIAPMSAARLNTSSVGRCRPLSPCRPRASRDP
jgi:hypothetical protein